MTELSGGEYGRSLLEDPTQHEDVTQNADSGTGYVIGTPDDDTSTWDGEQSYPDTCAIRCQEFVLERFTGQEIDERGLVQEAEANGWYRPGIGTLPEDMGNILEANGISVNTYLDATTYDLANELARGHKVIIAVDAGELLGQENPTLESITSNAELDGPDHAVVVSGIDTTDPEHPRVIISDPGTGEAETTYPLDQFVAAWQDSGFYMVATQEPPPAEQKLPEMANFDYDVGHIPMVLGLPYEAFVALEDQLEEWVELLKQGPQGNSAYVPDESAGAVTPVELPPVEPAEIPVYSDESAGSADTSTYDQNVVDPNALVDDPDLLGPTVPGLAIDPNLLDPSAPGPTIDPNLLIPTASGPTIDPTLLDSSEPGATLDPGLLDPNSPGSTLDAALFDQSMLGPTLDPSLLDPTSPGPTIDPNLLDVAAPGPTLDPSLLDPTSPGPTIDPNLLDPRALGPTLDPDQLEATLMEPSGVTDLGGFTEPGLSDPDPIDPDTVGQSVQDQEFFEDF